MQAWFHMLLIMLFESLSARRDAQVRFLKLQVEILKKKLPANRVIIDPTDRKRLLALGEELSHEVKDTLLLVSVKTYKHWINEQRAGKPGKKVGRPRIDKMLMELVIRLAKENVGWGVNRILGELKKLGEYLGRSSIRRVMKQEGLYPDPHRRAHRVPDSPWRKFIELHMNSIVACDFFCKEVLTPLGKKTAHLLIFIHLETRKVFLSPATLEPNEQWVCQQARNVMMYMGEAGIKQRFILHDRDTKFSEEFDETFRDDGIEVVKTPFQAPDANAFAESWIGNFKREVLNHFMCFGLKHLDYIAGQAMDYYNDFRPHQSKANEPLRFPSERPPIRASAKGEVECRTMLGGLLKHYYRRVA